MSEIGIWDLTAKQRRNLCPIDPPRRPAIDFRWYCLIIPVVCGFMGLFLFNVPSMAFLQLSGEQYGGLLSFFTLAGSFGMMLGSDMGTIVALLEIFRKWGTPDQTWVDWVSLLVSMVASISCAYLSWGWQISNILQTTFIIWLADVQIWGPLVATVAIIIDLTMSGAEAGLYLRDYGLRFHQWYEKEYKPALNYAWYGTTTVQTEEVEQTSILQPQVDKVAEGVYYDRDKGYFVQCPMCDWVSDKYYKTKRAASGAYGGHKGKCPNKTDF